MSQSYNRVILVGRLTKDPELRYSTSQLPFVNFAIGVDRQPSKNQPEPGADFPRIVAFGKTAEFVANYLTKGRLILVEGRLQTQRYTAQDGTTRYTTDVIADSIRFMESKSASRSGGESQDDSYGTSYQPYGANSPSADGPSEDMIEGPSAGQDPDDDNVPF